VWYSPITSLRGMPSRVGQEIAIHTNELTSLDGFPQDFAGRLKLGCNVHDIKALPRNLQDLEIWWHDDLPLLQLMYKKPARLWLSRSYGGPGVKTQEEKEAYARRYAIARDIMDRYLPQGNAGLSAAATELIKAGLKNNARL